MIEVPESPMSPVSPPPMPLANPPGQIKVLGVLHLVLAGVGVLLVLYALVSRHFSKVLLSAQQTAGGLQETQARFTQAITESAERFNWFSYASSVLLAVLLVVAGIGLLKSRRSGLAWSNRYAWTSIGLKIVNLILCVTMVIPEMNRVLAEFDGQGPEFKMLASIMKPAMIATLVVTPIVSCVYPVLVLVLLNRESVRKSLI